MLSTLPTTFDFAAENIGRLKRKLWREAEVAQDYPWNIRVYDIQMAAQALESASGVGGMDATDSMRNKLADRRAKFTNLYNEYSSDMRRQAEATFHNANLELEAKERWIKRITWFCYALFAIGWIISLITTLIGKPAERTAV